MFKLQKGLIVQKLDDQVIIFDAEESVLYTLNETAGVIFDKIRKKWSKEKIVEYMIKHYEVKEERVRKDLDKLVNDLKKKKILVEDKDETKKTKKSK